MIGTFSALPHGADNLTYGPGTCSSQIGDAGAAVALRRRTPSDTTGHALFLFYPGHSNLPPGIELSGRFLLA